MARTRVRYRPGDLFRIPCPRRRVAYGQILLDVNRLWNRTKIFDKQDCSMAGPITGLLIRVFNHKGARPRFAEFDGLRSWPPFFLFDNKIAQGEYPIVGHLPVSEESLDFPEGTMSHGFPTESYTFEKGGISVKISLSEDEYNTYGGCWGVGGAIDGKGVVAAIDGDRTAAKRLYGGFSDLRISRRRKAILTKAGLETKMTYPEMVARVGGVSRDEMLEATEQLFPGSTRLSQ